MGIYIPGVEMPESCGKCLGVGWHYVFECVLDDVECGERRTDCPLVIVPDHGDLIDRETVRDYWLDASWNFPKMKVGDEKDIFVVIESVPTVIPAEEGGDG